MEKESYFIINRKIFESKIWSDDPHVLKLFIWLIGNARHNKIPKRYPRVIVNRGELVTSLLEISENNEYVSKNSIKRWSRAKVSRMLKKLIKEKYINIVSDTYGTHIKVCNYDHYQQPKRYQANSSETDANSSETVVKQERNSSETVASINKNDKNDKKDNTYIQLFGYWNSKEIIVHRKLTDKMKTKIRVALENRTKEEIIRAIDNYATVLKSEEYYWTYEWIFEDFLVRGLSKFVDEAHPLTNFLSKNNPAQNKTNNAEALKEWGE